MEGLYNDADYGDCFRSTPAQDAIMQLFPGAFQLNSRNILISIWCCFAGCLILAGVTKWVMSIYLEDPPEDDTTLVEDIMFYVNTLFLSQVLLAIGIYGIINLVDELNHHNVHRWNTTSLCKSALQCNHSLYIFMIIWFTLLFPHMYAGMIFNDMWFGRDELVQEPDKRNCCCDLFLAAICGIPGLFISIGFVVFSPFMIVIALFCANKEWAGKINRALRLHNVYLSSVNALCGLVMLIYLSTVIAHGFVPSTLPMYKVYFWLVMCLFGYNLSIFLAILDSLSGRRGMKVALFKGKPPVVPDGAVLPCNEIVDVPPIEQEMTTKWVAPRNRAGNDEV